MQGENSMGLLQTLPVNSLCSHEGRLEVGRGAAAVPQGIREQGALIPSLQEG